ncbi:hypothetical protein [Vibrio phage vB_VhaS-tm]|nr:hypothetical protein [Vibrio phage vB_VhaS-tm]
MTTFKPMLAVNSKPEDINVPSYGSIKLEGVRGEFTPEGLLSRQLKQYNNELIYEREDVHIVEAFCEEFNIVLEGEWYLHGWTFNRIDSSIRGNGNIDVKQLEFHVFDCFVYDRPDSTFEERVNFYYWAVQELNRRGATFVKRVDQVTVNDADCIRSGYAWAIDNGYEGFCIKAKQLTYKHGRSTLKQQYFTRLKPEKDYDCVVLAIIERQANLCESEINELGYLKKKQNKDMKASTGMAQTALVYTPELGNVHKVSLTRNLTDPDRLRIWEDAEFYPGKCMTFVGIPVPGQNIPRSPRFDKWRLDIEPQFLQHDPSDSMFVSWDAAEVEHALQNGCDLINFEQFQWQLADAWTISNNSIDTLSEL